MNGPQKPSDAWRTFSYLNTGASLVVIAALLFFIPIEPLVKVAFGVAVAWALSNVVNVTKLTRDKQEFDDWREAQKNQKSLPDASPRVRTAEV